MIDAKVKVDKEPVEKEPRKWPAEPFIFAGWALFAVSLFVLPWLFGILTAVVGYGVKTELKRDTMGLALIIFGVVRVVLDLVSIGIVIG